MVTNARKAWYRRGKTNKINQNVVRVGDKRITACIAHDTELVFVEKLSQYTYRPIYPSVLQVKYFSVSTLALTYVNNYMNRFHGHKRANSMVSTGKNKQNQSKCGKSR